VVLVVGFAATVNAPLSAPVADAESGRGPPFPDCASSRDLQSLGDDASLRRRTFRARTEESVVHQCTRIILPRRGFVKGQMFKFFVCRRARQPADRSASSSALLSTDNWKGNRRSHGTSRVWTTAEHTHPDLGAKPPMPNGGDPFGRYVYGGASSGAGSSSLSRTSHLVVTHVTDCDTRHNCLDLTGSGGYLSSAFATWVAVNVFDRARTGRSP
jgi:hypothetical protein